MSLQLTLPFEATVSTSGNAFSITNIGTGPGVTGKSTGGIGVYGRSDLAASNVPDAVGEGGAGIYGQNNQRGGIGVRGTADTGFGVDGRSNTGPGVRGTSASGAAVLGQSTDGPGVVGKSANDIGVRGENSSANRVGTMPGVYGKGKAEDGGHFISAQANGLYAEGGNSGAYITGQERGLYVESKQGNAIEAAVSRSLSASTSARLYNSAVYVHHDGGSGTGVYATAVGSISYGIQGKADYCGIAGTGGRIGIRGIGLETGVIGSGLAGLGLGVLGVGSPGVKGYSETGGIGVMGASFVGQTCIGVLGQSATGRGYAGMFDGDVLISDRLLVAGSKSFIIDHPLDPARKYLCHSTVESPDMKTIYDGVVTLGARGEAVIKLPAWFEALNQDYRYQLTCIDSFAPVYVAEEVRKNHFKIAGGTRGMKVSWQVTGVRHDPYAEQNRMQVEVKKPAKERGKYLHPKEHGKPETAGLKYERVQKTKERIQQFKDQSAKGVDPIDLPFGKTDFRAR